MRTILAPTQSGHLLDPALITWAGYVGVGLLLVLGIEWVWRYLRAL